MSTASIPKGLHHLESTVPHKFTNRFSSRVMHQKKFIQPRDRIARWNVRQGDYVRLTVGKSQDKFVNGVNENDGWKVHQVTQIDMERNTLRLSGVTYKKANQTLRELPSNASETERREFEGQRNFMNISRPIHYSNVQLCIDQESEKGGKSVFASRIATSKPVWDKRLRLFRYDRFAAGRIRGTEDESKYEVDEDKGLIKVNWVAFDKAEVVEPLPTDTRPEAVAKSTLRLVPSSDIWSKPETVPLATSSRAPVNKLPRSISDAYINLNATSAVSETEGTGPTTVDLPAEVDTMMPLYLSEELSPRFSRAKATRGWNLARAAEREEREKYAAQAVQKWRESGKDANLTETLSRVGLGGVTIRSRTAQEVRSAAQEDYENALFERSRIARLAKRAGGTFDVVNDQWKVELDPAKLKRALKKAERAKRKETFLRLNKLTV